MSGFIPNLAVMLNHAVAQHQAGQWGPADAAYRQVLAFAPDHPDALHLYGVLLHQTGRTGPAEQAIRRAITLQPKAGAYHNNLGNLLRDAGRLQEAVASYRAALRLQPNMPQIHHHLGLALDGMGDTAGAETALRNAIRLQKDYATARLDLGNLLCRIGKPREAEACLKAALRVQPDDPKILNALGMAQASQNQHELAVASFTQALAMTSIHTPARANLAASLGALGRTDEALDYYAALVAETPDDASLLRTMGQLLVRQKRLAEAEEILGKVTTLSPDDADVLQEYGALLVQLERPAEALIWLDRAIAVQPAHVIAHHDRGIALRDMGDWAGALPCVERAVAIAPNEPWLHDSLAEALLANGNMSRGWQELEWRLKKPGSFEVKRPTWDGKPTDKIVLIHTEQGLGDMLQFCRFVPLAAARAPLVFAGPAPLARLLTRLPGVDLYGDIGNLESLPPFDLHIPLMSLPHALGITEQDLPGPIPYLHADAASAATWRDRLASLPGRRVGLVWAGNPVFPKDQRRSIPFAALAPLRAVPGVSFVSLQKGPASADHGGAVHDYTADLHDFADTAALVSALDLVISVDTAVLHLAGALGRPAWLLNRADTCWRWMTHRDDSPWYPTLRIFRQATPGDWSPVIDAAAQALA